MAIISIVLSTWLKRGAVDDFENGKLNRALDGAWLPPKIWEGDQL